MLISEDRISGILWDFVVIGSGPAGLMVAEKIKRSGRTLVLERGNDGDPLNEGGESYGIDVAGRAYRSNGMRLAAFGGTSNHWAGHTHFISPTVFAGRGNVRGWAIDHSDYLRYLDEASEFLNLGPVHAAPEMPSRSPLFSGARNLDNDEFRISNPVRRLGMGKSRSQLRDDPDVSIALDCRVDRLELSQSGSSVEKIHVISRGNRQVLRAKRVVVACGGIENARLLLWSGQSYRAGNPLVGGDNGNTGRYFMEHALLAPLEVLADNQFDVDRLNPSPNGPGVYKQVWRPTEDFLDRKKLPRFGVIAWHRSDDERLNTMMAESRDHYFETRASYQLVKLVLMFEQLPNPQSCVGLSEQRDASGSPLAKLDWRIPESEVEGFRRATIAMAGLLSQTGAIRARLAGGFDQEDWNGVRIGASAHHMGTTRMAQRPADGVVDSECRVFGLNNLYVAGSSVFPAGDYVNPTLSIVMLAARLGEHLTHCQTQPGRQC